MRGPLRAALILVSALLPTAARGMTFDEALARAVTRPDVTAPDAASSARASMDRDLPGRLGNPELVVGLGPGNTLPGFRDIGVEFQATLTQPWAIEDLGGARRRSADAERAWLSTERRRRALEQRRHAARAWLALWTAQRLHHVAHEEADAAQALAAMLSRGVTAGAAVTGDALEAELAAGEAQARVLDAEGMMAETASALAVSTGSAPLPQPTADGDAPSPAIPPQETWARWVEAAGALPEVEASAWLARAATLVAQESAAGGGSWLSFGAQAVRNSADQWQLYAMLGLRWSASDRNQRARAQALGGAALAQGDLDAARRRAPAALALALHEVEHTRAMEQLLRERTVPAAERLTVAREEALRRGAGTAFEVLRARSARLRARAELTAAEGRRREAELDAWLLLSALPRGAEAR